MRIFSAVLLLVFASLLLVLPSAQSSRSSSTRSGQSLTVVGACAEQQAFQVDVQADTGGGPHLTVRNLCDESLTALYLQKSAPGDGKVESGLLWDAVIQNQPSVPKDGSLSLPIPHREGQPLSGKSEVGAAIWANGSTFGNPEQLRKILSNRTAAMWNYTRAISVLEKGLKQNWTRDEYLAAWVEQNKGAPMTSAAAMMEANLRRNPSADSPDALKRVMHNVLEIFIQRRDILRQSKPELDPVGNPD